MNLDRLTYRARRVIINVSAEEKSEVSVASFLDEIVKLEGMGSVILNNLPKLKQQISKENKTLSVDINNLVRSAYYQSLKFNQSYVGTEHLLLALLSTLKSAFLDEVQEEILKLSVFPKGSVASQVKKNPIIESFGTSLNHKVIAESNKPLIYREEFDTLLSILLQRKNFNPLIVGEAGVGKKTLIDLLAKSINSMDVPPDLIGYRVVEIDLLSFITSNFNKGGVEYGLMALVEELKGMGRVILSISNFQNLFFSTNLGMALPLVYSTFKSYLVTTNIKCIATMNESLYTKLLTENEHILDEYSVVHLTEPSESDTLNILKANARVLGEYHNLDISDEVISYIYKKAKSEIREIKFPQKGIDLMDQSCAKYTLRKRKVPENYKSMVEETVLLTQGLDKSLAVENYENALEIRARMLTVEDKMWTNEKRMFAGKRQHLSFSDVDAALQDYGIGPDFFAQSDPVLHTLAQRIKTKIIGQEEAVDAISKSLIRSKLGLRSKKRPLGTFLFLGPTGVGKTELAKVLAEEAFGESSLIRLDMSDFAEKHNVARLVGAPPGYVGYGEGGDLTSKIETNPHSVVLFDEIEKAHPDVLNILLQITEEGELVDAKGNTFDFTKAVVILTSNLGTEIIHSKGIGFEHSTLNDSKIEERLKSNLKKILKPELLNRLDDAIVFRRLNMSDQAKILDLMLEEVKEILLRQNMALRIGKKAKKLLLDMGYSEEYGARSLRRTVDRELLDKIAELLLKTFPRPGKISATVSGKTLSIKAVKSGTKA